MSNAYFQDELRYLRDVGPEFARSNPEIARMLGDRGTDPDVERLLEGVAFMCGRVREKLDDELPEITASMMSMLWPHYLRPIPSMSVLEFQPEIDQMQGPYRVEQNAEFGSARVDGTSCRYRSAWPVSVRPWRISKVVLETEAARPARLRIWLDVSPKAAMADMDLNSVRLHLAGDPRTAFTIYYLLAAHTDHITVSDGSESPNRSEHLLPGASVLSAGFDRRDAVLPYPKRSFVGYRLLQEYFVFKERFLFVDVAGLDQSVAALDIEGGSIELAFTFNHRLESYPTVSSDNIRLHCVPIVNLFNQAADPIRLRHDRVQYLIQPSQSGVADRRHQEVYSVDQVFGVNASAGVEPYEIKPFYSFNHMATSDSQSATYYQTRLTPNVLGGDARLGTDTYVSFVIGEQKGDLPQDETISVELTCTNRDLPTELRAGDINEPTDSSPPGIRFRNIIKPTSTVCPPIGKKLHWRLISHMSLNYVSLTDVEHLRELLRIYDFLSEHDAQEALARQRMLDGIVSVNSRFTQRVVRGAPLRGVQIEVTLNEDHFAGDGDAYLFGCILDRFFGLYVTLNGFSQLNLHFERTGQVYKFKPRWGEQHTPADLPAEALTSQP